ncbi:hypothetical protein EVAR_36012_1 [Eumeta japonica]|uniref:Uncharacterized protein n=1 Tax=Eumeta variegata TaxID=151549 RepID=A0A4C1WWL5_EUMVA|nr:hypothetical protein EVAR_36012_1 [Eumeta japonica]
MSVQVSYQSIADDYHPWTFVNPEELPVGGQLSGKNRICIERGSGCQRGKKREWAAGILTQWTKGRSGNCYFTSVFRESNHRSCRPIFVLL